MSKEYIGEPTHEGRFIELISVNAPNETADYRENKPSVLYTGATHSRELVTIKMILAVMLKLLHGVHYEDTESIKMLETTQVYLMPAVNPDGVAYIESNEIGNGEIVLKRKNMNPAIDCRDPVDNGVDLNRNFDVSW